MAALPAFDPRLFQRFKWRTRTVGVWSTLLSQMAGADVLVIPEAKDKVESWFIWRKPILQYLELYNCKSMP